MFGSFTSPDSKARRKAQHWLEVAETVRRFRHDVMKPEQLASLLRAKTALTRLVDERANAKQITAGITELELILREVGGAFYPRTVLAENVEFLVVAAIAIIGFKTFFIQPMVIPTNSMWPSYYGMTAENFPPGTPAPGLPSRVARFVTLGALQKEVDAPVDGELVAPFFIDTSGVPHLASGVVDGRTWLIFPAKYSEYTFLVGGQPARIRVPVDFHDFEQVFLDTYFPERGALRDQWERARVADQIRSDVVSISPQQQARIFYVPLGRTLKKGDPIIRFDLLKGDMVAVDRMSWNFVRPKVGSGFVFETGTTRPGLANPAGGDQYLIKRLAGQAGDQLEIREPALFRNGKPIAGAAAFGANASREGKYRGYLNLPENVAPYLTQGKVETVPLRSFMALGDNSTISMDGRYWGFVPEKAVVGRPLFIYFPFTKRWGIAR